MPNFIIIKYRILNNVKLLDYFARLPVPLATVVRHIIFKFPHTLNQPFLPEITASIPEITGHADGYIIITYVIIAYTQKKALTVNVGASPLSISAALLQE